MSRISLHDAVGLTPRPDSHRLEYRPYRLHDFQQSIFGILVRGEDVRDAISNVAVGGDERPVDDVVIEAAESFVDEQNGVLMLKVRIPGHRERRFQPKVNIHSKAS